jgi:hypothetical protein
VKIAIDLHRCNTSIFRLKSEEKRRDENISPRGATVRDAIEEFVKQSVECKTGDRS